MLNSNTLPVVLMFVFNQLKYPTLPYAAQEQVLSLTFNVTHLLVQMMAMASNRIDIFRYIIVDVESAAIQFLRVIISLNLHGIGGA